MEEKPRVRDNIAGILVFVLILALLFYGSLTDRLYVWGIPFMLYGLYALINGKIWVWRGRFTGSIAYFLIKPKPGEYPKARYLTNLKEARAFGILLIMAGIAIIVITKIMTG